MIMFKVPETEGYQSGRGWGFGEGGERDRQFRSTRGMHQLLGVRGQEVLQRDKLLVKGRSCRLPSFALLI